MGYAIKGRLTLLFLFLGGALCFPSGAAEPDFQWAFVASEKGIREQTPEEVPFSLLKNKLTFYFKPVTKVYLYLLLSGPGYHMKMIFPESFDRFSDEDYVSNEHYIPEDGDWLTFKKEPGAWQLDVVVSKNRISELENLITEYRTLARKGNRYEELLRLKKRITPEVNALNRQTLFSSNKTEQEPVMGSFMNNDSSRQLPDGMEWLVEKEIREFADSVELDKYFIRTFYLEYQ